MATLLFTADHLFVKVCPGSRFLSVIHKLFLHLRERYMSLFCNLVKLVKLHLVLTRLVGIWRECHLCLIQLIKHDWWLNTSHRCHLKTCLFNGFLINPGIAWILHIGSLVKLICLLASTRRHVEFLRAHFVLDLKLIERTAFNRHLRLKITALWAIHFCCLLEDKLFRGKIRIFHVKLDRGSLIVLLQWIASCRSVIYACGLRPCHQCLLGIGTVGILKLVKSLWTWTPSPEGWQIFEHINAVLWCSPRWKTHLERICDVTSLHCLMLNGPVSCRVWISSSWLRWFRHQ